MILLQRARGHFGLDVRRDGPSTRKAGLEQGGCCRLLFPRVAGDGLEAVTVNISGGVAAGDRIEGRVNCGPGSDLLVTSQAAERVYRARPDDPPAEIDVTCRVGEGARLDWLPHGTIFFDGSHVRRRISVDMAASARFLFLETRIFGRTASGERVRRLRLRDRLSVRRDGCSVMEDMLRLESDDAQELLAGRATAGGQVAVTTLIMVSPDAERHLAPLRDVLAGEDGFAASAWNGMLVVRGLTSGGWSAETVLRRVLPVLRTGRSMPATWKS